MTSTYGFDKVNISFLESRKDEISKSPLVITPRWDDSLEFLCGFLNSNRPWAEEQIVRYGAIIIRGFRVENAVDFEKAVATLQPRLSNAYRGTSPRSVYPGTKYAFSAADVPANYPIAQHLEMSFLKEPPRNLYFGCLKASKTVGGETSLCDFRKVYQDLSPELRTKLLNKKIKYTRTHHKVGERFTYDVGAMLGWPGLFGTSDAKKVEEICREEGAPLPQWKGFNKTTFHQEWIDEPFQVHPDTNETVWFNHSQVFHWTTFPAELWHAFLRVKDIKLLIHCILVSIFCFIKYGLLGYKMSLNTTYGDGTPISWKEMGEIRNAIHKNMVYSRWQKGDIMCIDNFSTSHGRQPTYDKGRKVCVAWSEPQDKAISRSAATSLKEAAATVTLVNNDTEQMPELVGVSPDNSPASTLTKDEAEFLSTKVPHGISSGKRMHRSLASCPAIFDSESEFWQKVKSA